MRLQEFKQEVNKSIKKLPLKYRELLSREEIEVISREKPPAGVYSKYGKKTIFGLFAGVSKKNTRTFSIQTEPTRIEIYKDSFEKIYGPDMSGEMKEHIFKTVVHEIAHYLGFNEEEIRGRGY